MDLENQLASLLDLARQLGVVIRHSPPCDEGGRGGGSLVRLKGKEIFFLNGDAPVEEQVQSLGRALAARPEIQAMFLPPEIRELIDGPNG